MGKYTTNQPWWSGNSTDEAITPVASRQFRGFQRVSKMFQLAVDHPVGPPLTHPQEHRRGASGPVTEVGRGRRATKSSVFFFFFRKSTGPWFIQLWKQPLLGRGRRNRAIALQFLYESPMEKTKSPNMKWLHITNLINEINWDLGLQSQLI